MLRDVLTFILAGGRGQRLDPLTRDRAKPAVPFGGIYRIIDFTLSNCVNSGLRRVHVLTQYKSFSLQKHLLAGWDVVSTQLGEFIDVIPAQQRIGSDWYKGTADAIYQNMYTMEDTNSSGILVLSGDHIYKMNYAQMFKQHQEQQADVTVACLPMPKENSKEFGVIEVDSKGRIKGFQEKPDNPKVIPQDKKKIYASMGVYLFNREVLEQELKVDAAHEDSRHDFGRDVIPQMLKNKRRVFVYNFVDEAGQAKYWRDIGTRDAYYQANMDLLNPDSDFDLYDRNWPVRTYHEQYPPIRMVKSQSASGTVINSMLSGGCIIEGGYVERSILSPNIKVGDGAEIRNSVIMEGAVIEKGVKIKNAIIDKDVRVPADTRIGYDQDSDRKRFVLTTSGIVIVPKRTIIAN